MIDAPKEIERRFLVTNDTWKRYVERGGVGKNNTQEISTDIQQIYLSTDPQRVVRVRLYGDEASLTIKGESLGPTRLEFNYPIPKRHANILFTMGKTQPVIKRRYLVSALPEHLWWDIDVFTGDNEGLIIAEIELNNENETFEKPDWLGPEVTNDHRYSNLSLAQHPYKKWRTS